MAILIEDARGKGYKASVSVTNRLNVSAKTAQRSFYINRDDGECYNVTTSFSAATGNEVIYIKNDSKTKKMYIDLARVGGVNTGLFEVFEVTGTAAGTEITPKNLNLASSQTADATAYGDASVTGLTIGDRIAMVRVPANSSADIPFESTVILGLTDAIAITYTGSTGIVDALIRFWYEGET